MTLQNLWRVVCGMVLVASCAAWSAAAPVTFRFEVVVSELNPGTLNPFGTLAPGDRIDVIFEYKDFNPLSGNASGVIRVDLGALLLESNKYNYSVSDDGSGILPPNPNHDGVTLYCPGGTSTSCDLAPVDGTLLGWDGSFGFGGQSTVLQTPALDLRQADTWKQFDGGDVLISIGDVSNFGIQATLRGDVDLTSFSIVPEPTSLFLAVSALIATVRIRSRFY